MDRCSNIYRRRNYSHRGKVSNLQCVKELIKTTRIFIDWNLLNLNLTRTLIFIFLIMVKKG